jgi:alkylation response protein AidB-like acyl-CoA dehydrogenase
MTDAFRAEVRDWLAAHVPAAPLPSFDTAEGFEAHRAWERSLAEARLAVITWPAAYGGRDATLAEWLVFEEEHYKVFWSELDVVLHETALDLLGPWAEVRDGPDGRWLEDYLFAVAGPIYAGTNEIQRTMQLIGAARALLEASVRHAGVRVQFGRPVGAFQAVKHRLADVAIGLQFARPLLDAAAVALGEDAPTAGRDVSAAKVACTEAAYRAARAALQVHGAIGYTAEHELSRFLLQVRALIPAWGGPAEHRARVLRELG